MKMISTTRRYKEICNSIVKAESDADLSQIKKMAQYHTTKVRKMRPKCFISLIPCVQQDFYAKKMLLLNRKL